MNCLTNTHINKQTVGRAVRPTARQTARQTARRTARQPGRQQEVINDFADINRNKQYHGLKTQNSPIDYSFSGVSERKHLNIRKFRIVSAESRLTFDLPFESCGGTTIVPKLPHYTWNGFRSRISTNVG